MAAKRPPRFNPKTSAGLRPLNGRVYGGGSGSSAKGTFTLGPKSASSSNGTSRKGLGGGIRRDSKGRFA